MVSALTLGEIQAAADLWEQYQQSHDLSEHIGGTAGIDPHVREIWIGRSIADVVQQRRDAGLMSPVVFKRIGENTYNRKGLCR